MKTSNWAGRMTAAAAAAVSSLALASGQALAVAGQPVTGQIGFQDPVTEVAEHINWFHNGLVNPIIIAITVFVMILMGYVMFRFSERRNPTPSRTTHNTALEVAWTVIPILILVVIAVPSFRLLYLQYSFPKPDITMKAIGNAWFWEYEYPDNGNVKVTSNMVTDEELVKAKVGDAEFNSRFGKLVGTDRSKALFTAAEPLWLSPPDKYAGARLVRQLSVDNEIAVPVNKVVHLLITSKDVIHSWTIPSFGSKMQAVPGRTTATWFKPTKEGVYYGQCSVLCGKEHASMPIAVRVVSDKAFADWLAAAKSRDWKKARSVLAAATEGMEKRDVAELTGDLR